MSEYIDLIQKEKQEALREYNEDAFRLRLNQKIAEKTKPSHSYVRWFQKPAMAGSAVLMILFFGWLSTQIFLPTPQESEAINLKNTFVQLFSQHAAFLTQSPIPTEVGLEKTAIQEFEWSLKRVIFAIQRENLPDEDISQNVSKVLQNTAVLLKAENNKSGEWNI
jgi:hypothetical protein